MTTQERADTFRAAHPEITYQDVEWAAMLHRRGVQPADRLAFSRRERIAYSLPSGIDGRIDAIRLIVTEVDWPAICVLRSDLYAESPAGLTEAAAFAACPHVWVFHSHEEDRCTRCGHVRFSSLPIECL